MPRYLIMGTDTDCGKTYVTCQLLKNLPNTIAIKPVQSGGAEDTDAIKHHQPHWDGALSRWSFEPPIAPHLAAADVGETISFDALDDFCDARHYPQTSNLLIETSGGVMCPLNDSQTWLDYAAHSQIPVIFVVGVRLGCINHALLTAHAFKTYGITCAGWIANLVDPEMKARDGNLKILKQNLPFRHLAEVPFGGTMPNELDLTLL